MTKYRIDENKIVKLSEGFELIKIPENGIINGSLWAQNKGYKQKGFNFKIIADGKFNFPFRIKEVTGDFTCRDSNMISLKGAPIKVGGYFNCSKNKLTSLEGCPNKVGGDFRCEENKLTSLEGCPNKVGGNFMCYDNKLTSLEGCPKYVENDFDIRRNTKKFTVDEIRAVCNVRGQIFV
jgi:hypothetical protein